MQHNELIRKTRLFLGDAPVVSRFAPAPTGYLHVGHVVSCLHVFGLTRALAGQVLVRIEDHDTTRSRPKFDEAIREDLEWLGLTPDRSPWPGFGAFDPDLRQSHRANIHAARLAELGAQGHVYRCDCPRSSMTPTAGGELFHQGLCKSRSIANDTPHGLRVRMPDRDIRFEDLIAGPQAQNPFRQTGDLLARDRHGCFTYQFCCAVDDLDQGVNLIIRGQDLLASTGRQLALRALLAKTPGNVLFCHHGLIVDETGRKLGKRFLSSSIRQMRLDGQSPESVLGLATFLAGKLDRQGSLDLPSALALFAR